MKLDFNTIFWIFFILMLIQPALKRKMLDSARMSLMHRIERARNSRVIILIHRQETMSLLGFPLFRYIDINDSEEVIRAVRLTDPEVPIDLVLHTPGGLVLAALQIAHAIAHREGKVTVFVPHYAMSGGTLIALAANEIVMDENSVLGPVDPQIGQFPAASILTVLDQKDKNRIDDQTLILADVARKAMRQVKEEAFKLLKNKIDEEKAEQLADLLVKGNWTHDHPITCDDAIKMGLPVTKGIPKEIFQLMNLFPQPVKWHPAVQYIPGPHPAPRRADHK